MSCENCGSCSTDNGTPKGCGDKGHCSSGGCNKLNTFDWLSDLELPDNQSFDIVEIGFKNNARKEFFKKPSHLHLVLGDNVLVESAGGFDIGSVSLSGELVRLQMQKKRIRENSNFPAVLRPANERDMERLQEVRSLEKNLLVQARAVARQLDLDMKIGDIEFQGDGRKLTFFYTSEGRVDFRELIRIYAKEFKVKIEMRQIGARQESARLGGIGTCGRELCCSTWLADFKSVSTVAARYQNLAINQSKLSGQCGRLKCCLNYELKTYLDALRDIPRNVERLDTERGLAVMVKMDIFKKIMYFGYKQQFGVTDIQPLPVDQVRLIHQLNREGLKPVALNQLTNDETPVDFAQVLNGNDQERRSRHREQGQNLHKQIADNEQHQEDEAIVLPSMGERKKKKPTNNKPKKPLLNAENTEANPNTENTEANTNTEKTVVEQRRPNPNQQNRQNQPKNQNQPNQQNRQNPNQNRRPKIENQDGNTETNAENQDGQIAKPIVEQRRPNQQNRQNQPKNQPKTLNNADNTNETANENTENKEVKTPNQQRHPNRQNQPKTLNNTDNTNETANENTENKEVKTPNQQRHPNQQNRTKNPNQQNRPNPNQQNRRHKTENIDSNAEENIEKQENKTEKPNTENRKPNQRPNPNQRRRPNPNQQQTNKSDSNNPPPPPPANE